MTVSFTYTEEDALAWYRLYLTRTSQGKESYQEWQKGVVFWYGFLGAMLVGGIWFRPRGVEWVLLFAAAAWIAGVVRVALNLTARRTIDSWGKNLLKSGYFQSYLTPMTVTVTKEGLRFVSLLGDGLTHWYSGYRIEEVEDHFYIFTSDTEYTQIPKRAFAAEADQVAFKAFVEKSIATAPALETVQEALRTDAKDWWRNA